MYILPTVLAFRSKSLNLTLYVTLLLFGLACVPCNTLMAQSSEPSGFDTGSADAGDTVTTMPNMVSKRQTAFEKNVTFYTSYGYQIDQSWRIVLKLWVSEPANTARRLLGKRARSTIRDKSGIDTLSDDQKSLYEVRVEDFIADSESREKVTIMFNSDPANKRYQLTDEQGDPRTDRNGNLLSVLTLPLARAQQLLEAQQSDNGWLSFKVVSKKHAGSGRIRLITPTGLSVISDIDDTIKDTGITKGHDLVLKNTFFEPFQQVPCMADLYLSFDSDVAFHYVSGAPWQLYTPLTDFMFNEDGGYPTGSMHMKNVRTNLSESESYTDIWELVSKGSKQVTYEQKLTQITQLLKHFPNRQFVLIGDSGERDPEVFAEIRHRFPANVKQIIIRDIDNQSEQNKLRYSNMRIVAGDANPANECPNGKSLLQ